MNLLTTADLESLTQEQKKPFIDHAMQLHVIWDAWKRQHDGKMQVVVDFWGERERKPGTHASELSGCARKLVYSHMGKKRIVLAQEKDVGMQRRFDMGTMTHALLQKEFHLMCAWYNNTQTATTGVYLTFEEEVDINPELGPEAKEIIAESSCDGRFTFWCMGVDNGGPAWVPFLRVGLEIKTSSDGEFQKLKEPKKDHKEQTCFYMTLLDVPLMWVLYYNKNNQRYTRCDAPFLFQYDKTLWKSVLRPRIDSAMNMAREGKLPARKEGMPCGWCPWAYDCKPKYLQQGRQAAPVSPKDF